MPELTSPHHHSKQIGRHLGPQKIVSQPPCSLLLDRDMPPAHCPHVIWKYSLRKNSLLPVSMASNKPGLQVQEVIIENNTLPASECWGLSRAQHARWGCLSCCASDLGLIHTAVSGLASLFQRHSHTQEGICSAPLC